MRKKHIIIGGVGRAGTTFLVQYFTACGFETGWSLEDAKALPDRISHAGLEHSITSNSIAKKGLPHVVKSPYFVDTAAELLGRGDLRVELAIIPIRDLHAAAESRRRVYREVLQAGGDPLRHPGTIWKTESPNEQESALAGQFYRLIEALAQHRVPMRFLHFPTFVQSHDYLYATLSAILTRHGITPDQSRAAHSRVVDVSLIHDFTAV